MFNSRFMALAGRLLPSVLYRRLDPFEASIQDFVRQTATRAPSHVHVLDAGAGECRFRPFFAHTRYVAIDWAQGDPDWNYSDLDVIGTLEELPFPDASFDRIISIVVLEHTPEPGKTIREFRRVLRPGGMIHMVVPHMWEEHQKPFDFFRFTSSGMRYLLETSGFSVTRVEPVGGFFWQLGRRLMGVLAFTQHGWRWVLFVPLAPVFGFILPLCCYYLDRIDRDRAYTLGFICEGSTE